MDFHDLLAQLQADDEWRDAHPGPLIWVTSLKRNAGLLSTFTPGSPEAPFGPTSYHYIGRSMPRSWLEGSALANPFRLADEDERPNVLERYRLWLIEQFHPGTAPWRDLGEILVRACDRRGIALGCWCAPKLCHGMIVRDAVLSMYASGWRPAHFPHVH